MSRTPSVHSKRFPRPGARTKTEPPGAAGGVTPLSYSNHNPLSPRHLR